MKIHKVSGYFCMVIAKYQNILSFYGLSSISDSFGHFQKSLLNSEEVIAFPARAISVGETVVIFPIFETFHFWNAVPKMEIYIPKMDFFQNWKVISKNRNADDTYL